jgi:hypothetical protein
MSGSGDVCKKTSKVALGLAIGLVLGGLVGFVVGNPIIFAGGGLVLGLAFGSALENSG